MAKRKLTPDEVNLRRELKIKKIMELYDPFFEALQNHPRIMALDQDKVEEAFRMTRHELENDLRRTPTYISRGFKQTEKEIEKIMTEKMDEFVEDLELAVKYPGARIYIDEDVRS